MLSIQWKLAHMVNTTGRSSPSLLGCGGAGLSLWILALSSNRKSSQKRIRPLGHLWMEVSHLWIGVGGARGYIFTGNNKLEELKKQLDNCVFTGFNLRSRVLWSTCYSHWKWSYQVVLKTIEWCRGGMQGKPPRWGILRQCQVSRWW